MSIIFSRPGMFADERCSKSFQRILSKQGLKFKLHTKVLSAEKKDGKVYLAAESAKDGKAETVRFKHLLLCLVF